VRTCALFLTTVGAECAARGIETSAGSRPAGGDVERVMTTRQMIDEGITGSDGVASFAIRLTKPLDLPQAELPIDPYLLGAFLGGGSSTDGTITVGAEDLAEFLANLEPIWPHHSVAKGGAAFRIALHKDPHSCGRGHRDDFVRKSNGNRACLACNREGNAARRAGATRTVRVNVPVSTLLGDAGLLKTKKHIPAEYMRASAAQRLALFQGLMDTDGTISKRGSCELALCNEDLALGALEPIRSLGIEASMTSGPAAITEADPERAGENCRRVVGTRWRIKFTTNRPVFRLPRKAARLKPTISSQSSMLYVQAIAPAPTEPGRCIQVDSPDSSYLTGDGYVPTQNTVILTSLTSFLSPAFAYERKVMAVADGTANAIDMAMNGLDNCFLLVDDWHPEVDPRERFKQAKALDQTLRRVHGAPSKARAMVDRQVDGVTLAPVNNSHPVLLLSTEKMPARQDAESMLDRMLTLNLAAESTFRKGDARRITHHGQSGLMQVANAGYLMWLAAKINGLSDDPVDAMQMWQKEVDDRRKEIAVAMGNQSRSSTARGTEVAAGMQAGVEMAGLRGVRRGSHLRTGRRDQQPHDRTAAVRVHRAHRTGDGRQHQRDNARDPRTEVCDRRR
jgi:hypothetical protein